MSATTNSLEIESLLPNHYAPIDVNTEGWGGGRDRKEFNNKTFSCLAGGEFKVIDGFSINYI